MIRKTFAAVLLASAATLAAAQPAPQQTAPAQSAQPIPAPTAEPRALAASRLVDAMWPQSELDALVREMVSQAGAEVARLDPEGARRDPHFAERQRITQQVIGEETARIVGTLAPDFRRLLAGHYARQFSPAELDPAAAFYLSPTGRRFARESLVIFASPEYQRAIESLTPQATRAMEGVSERLTAAMAQLPPPPGSAAARRPAPPRAAPPPMPPMPPMPPAPDLARLSPAQRAAHLVWPSAIFRHVADYRPVIETVLGMRISEFGIPFPAGPNMPANATVADMAGSADPQFRERAAIAARLFGEEMARFGAVMEPDFRRIMADMYGRRFTPAELEEVAGFYGTPAGQRFAAESYRYLEDPQFVRGMLLVLPRAAMQVPAVMQRVNAATAHLPPPPPPPPQTTPAPPRPRKN
jgi:hypothetical protein